MSEALKKNLRIYKDKKLTVSHISITQRSFQGLRLKYLLESIKDKKGRLIDVGSGMGVTARSVKMYRPDIEVKGCDASESSVSWAQEESIDIDYKICILPDLPYSEGSFEMIVGVDIFEHLDDPERTLKNIRRIIRNRGVFHCFIPCERSVLSLYKFNKFYKIKKELTGHVQKYSFTEAEDLFSNHFNIIKRNYSYHFIGQIFDIIRHGRLRKDPDYQNSKALNMMQNIAYYESKILSFMPLGAIGLHLTMTPK